MAPPRAVAVVTVASVALAAVAAALLLRRGLEEGPPPRPLSPPVPAEEVAIPETGAGDRTEVGAGPRPLEAAPVEASARMAGAPGPEPAYPPGTLLGIVLREASPVPIPVTQGDARVWPMTPGGFVPGSPPPEAGAAAASLDREGRFRVEGLEPGEHRVLVRVPPSTVQETHCEIDPAESPARVVLVLGSARVIGHVFDPHGRPVESALVTVGGVEGGASRSEARTGPDGFYAVGSLAAGLHWHSVYPSGDFWKKEGEVMRKIALAAGETKVLDVGSPRRRAIWSGTVRNHAGDPVVARGTIHLDARGPGGTTYRAFHFADDGTFEEPMEPGSYEVRLELGDGRRFDLGGIEMPDVDLVEDLVLPEGTRIAGRVRLPEAVAADPHGPPDVRVSIRVEGHDNPAGIHGVRVSPDGTFAFDAVAPGRYRVDAWPLKIAGTPEGWRMVEVAPGQATLVLDLDLEPR